MKIFVSSKQEFLDVECEEKQNNSKELNPVKCPPQLEQQSCLYNQSTNWLITSQPIDKFHRIDNASHYLKQGRL